MLLFVILALPVPQLILLATGRAAHFPGDCTWETVASSTSKTSEGLDSGQNGDFQNTLLNTIKFYVVLGGGGVGEEGWGKKGEGHHKSMWKVLIYKRNMCVVNFVLHAYTVFRNEALRSYVTKCMWHSGGEQRTQNIWANTQWHLPPPNLKWPPFRSGATRVPEEKLPRISYFKFLFSSICKLCQIVTVLSEITHARCFPQADYFLDGVIKNASAISKNKIMEKPLCFDHVKNISSAVLKSSCISKLRIWHSTGLSFRLGITFVNRKSAHTTPGSVWKNTVCTSLEETCLVWVFLLLKGRSTSTLGMLHSLFSARQLKHLCSVPQRNRYALGQGYKCWDGYSVKCRASHLLLVADLKGDKSMLITASR